MTPAYVTPRLSVFELTSDTGQREVSELLSRLPKLLTPAVTENLPPHFHDITSDTDAQAWYDRMMSESRLFIVKENDKDSIIGLLFASTEHPHNVHIGYLLGEHYWGQGLASELLQGFIQHVTKTENWTTLVGGVDKHNKASSRLLTKLGFVVRPAEDEPVVFYEYSLYSEK
ncbi:GNAT family N-acetyltransferase [Kangiella sediminilitoris]|uniref:Ferrichrome-binding protein n=1 Tax=Kangiella sediminilitoris TaxID=1144748 RepID=A0A1B3BDY8_9GAMM|nr:GNAT family N-acetyltransferase [Kangiella sediminilitoris]AOE50917.1 Ferrichrome-binding protein [Kangiella sediminilitoris]